MYVDAHRGGMKQHPPRQIFEKLVNKNAIKCKIGGPPWQFFLKPLTPPRNFDKNIPYPLPWIFNPCASMISDHIKRLPLYLLVLLSVETCTSRCIMLRIRCSYCCIKRCDSSNLIRKKLILSIVFMKLKE